MARCIDCGGYTYTMWGDFNSPYLCWDCCHKRKQAKIIEQSKTLTQCSDFKNWDSGEPELQTGDSAALDAFLGGFANA